MRSLPRVVSNIPSDLRNFLDRVREYLGEGSDNRFVTLGELKKGGIVGVTPGGSIVPPGEYGVQDPAMPRNLTATGAFAVIFLEWDPPNYLGHSHTEVWAADTDDFTTKVLVGTTEANSYGHEIGTGATKYYWIRFVNTLGTVGAFNGTAGTLGATSENPDYLIDVLSDAYGVTGDAPFFQLDTPTVINGVTIPAGTYIKQAWIADATISRAKIQDLAVDNAKINDLNVNKLTAGTMQIGSYIQSQSYVPGTSGWKINADGTAEFANAIVRGSIFGGGASNYSTGLGLFAGLDAGTYKFRVGNPAGNQLTWDGSALTITGTLSSSTISGGSISGSTISGGTITSGSASGPLTGAGFYVSGGVFRVGSPPSGSYMYWNGSTLTINGQVVGTSNLQDNAATSTNAAYVLTRLTLNPTQTTWISVPGVAFSLSNNSTSTTRVVLWVALDATQAGGNADVSSYRVKRTTDGTTLPTAPNFKADGASRVFSFVYIDESPLSGSNQYQLEVQAKNSDGTTIYIDSVNMVGTIYKK